VSAEVANFLYLIASVCFIMALKGLSSPESSRAGNLYGIAGMAIAIITTLVFAVTPGVLSYGTILAGIVIGGGIGAVIAQRIQMTALPQLVAAFHSLVGLAAVLVAAAAFYAPENYGIGTAGDVHSSSLIEMGLGIAIGAITFTGSIIAFAKLQALMSGAPIVFPGQHYLNGALGVAIVVLLVLLVITESPFIFWALVAVSLLLGFLLIIPIGGADMPVVVDAEFLFRLGRRRHRLYAGEFRAHHHRRPRRLLGRDFELHHVQRHEPPIINDRRRLRHRYQRRRPGQGPKRQAGEIRQRRGRRFPDEERQLGHHRAGLRHGGGAGPACAARDGRPAEEGRREDQLRHPSGRRPHARPYERAAGRSQRAL
jgi:hypothetical protein